MGKMKGTVKFYDRRKGWGFIAPDDGGPDVFVHYSNVPPVSEDNGYKALFVEDRVEYDVGPGASDPKKTQALNVTVLEESPARQRWLEKRSENN